MKAQQSILEQAKQGNAVAIGSLMQAPLSAKGITVNTHIKNGCLQVNLVADACPPKNASLSFIRNGMTHLNPAGIRAVRIDGYQTGSSTPSWISRIHLTGAESHEFQGLSDRIGDGPQAKNENMGKKLLIALGLIGILLLGVWAVMSVTTNNRESTPTTEQIVEPGF